MTVYRNLHSLACPYTKDRPGFRAAGKVRQVCTENGAGRAPGANKQWSAAAPRSGSLRPVLRRGMEAGSAAEPAARRLEFLIVFLARILPSTRIYYILTGKGGRS